MHLFLVLAVPILCIPMIKKKPSQSTKSILSRFFQLTTCSNRVSPIESDDIIFGGIAEPVDDKLEKEMESFKEWPMPLQKVADPHPKPGSIRTFRFSKCPDPTQQFSLDPKHLKDQTDQGVADTSNWKLFMVTPASGLSEYENGPYIEKARILFDEMRRTVAESVENVVGCNGKTLEIGGIEVGPQDHVVSLIDNEFAKESSFVFPANLHVPVVKTINLSNFFRTRLGRKNNEAGFQLVQYTAGESTFRSTVQVYGEETYLFYTQLNLNLALIKYKEIQELKNKQQKGQWLFQVVLPNFPFHPILRGLDVPRVPSTSLSNEISEWYVILTRLNLKEASSGNQMFPDSLMPLKVTVRTGEYLVFDKTMVYTRIDSKVTSVALFA